MASPQREDGHIDIANEIADALAKTELSSYESRILWVIWRQTYGWHKKEDVISLDQFRERTGIKDKAHIVRTLTKLQLRQIIARSGKRCSFQKDYDRWLEPISDFIARSGKYYFIARSGNCFACSGNGVARSGKNEWMKLKADRRKRTPKETISKETISKENTTVPNRKKPDSGPKQSKPKIAFNFETEEWENLSEKDQKAWAIAYPACEIGTELERAKQWLLSNPEKRKKNYRRFITNWLSRSQERGGSKLIEEKNHARRKTPKGQYKRNPKEGWEEKPEYEALYD